METKFIINYFDLIFLAAVFVGFTFSFLLMFTKRVNRKANLFLSLVLLTIALWLVWVLAIDIHLSNYFSYWHWTPLQYSLTIGPLLYFYVLTLTRPEKRFTARNLLHFSPLLLEQGCHISQVLESARTGDPTYNTQAFSVTSPILQLLGIISMLTYISLSIKVLKAYDQGLKDQLGNASEYESKWLQRLLILFCLLWLAWIPFSCIDYFFYGYALGTSAYYPLYMLMGVVAIWIGAEAFLRPELIFIEKKPAAVSTTAIAAPELKEAVNWLKGQLEANLFYLDAGLSLSSLADALGIHPHELSRIINAGTGNNFNDLINEYRMKEVIKKIDDPKYDNITLLGIAYDSGFNSKTTFNRTFKQFTGQSPSAYKNSLVKKATIL